MILVRVCRPRFSFTFGLYICDSSSQEGVANLDTFLSSQECKELSFISSTIDDDTCCSRVPEM